MSWKIFPEGISIICLRSILDILAGQLNLITPEVAGENATDAAISPQGKLL
jgi:hypothetical protein